MPRLSVTVNRIAVNTAEELGHGRERVRRWLSTVAPAATRYGRCRVGRDRGDRCAQSVGAQFGSRPKAANR